MPGSDNDVRERKLLSHHTILIKRRLVRPIRAPRSADRRLARASTETSFFWFLGSDGFDRVNIRGCFPDALTKENPRSPRKKRSEKPSRYLSSLPSPQLRRCSSSPAAPSPLPASPFAASYDAAAPIPPPPPPLLHRITNPSPAAWPSPASTPTTALVRRSRRLYSLQVPRSLVPPRLLTYLRPLFFRSGWGLRRAGLHGAVRARGGLEEGGGGRFWEEG